MPVMEFDLEKSLPILERTPKVLKELLAGLDESWIHTNEGGESWSPFDVVGHLLHGENTDWIARMEIILGDGPDKTFARFDRFAQFEESKGKTMSQLLDEFAAARAKNMAILKGKKLTVADMEKTGMHPALGPATLKQLLSTWVVHDLTHINQITRVMAKQYRGAIGPWIEFINLLRENK